ncbi:MAG: hypothetical protein HXK58_03520 [Campylobacter concisus]|nr:hypothetical protein [Campylobacter concisus]
MPRDFASLKNARNLMLKSLISWWIAILNLKSPIFVFWVGSFIFGALGVNRFMTGQIWLGIAKLALFLAQMILFIIITSAMLDAVANAATNEDLQNAIRLIRINSFIVGILGIVITIWWFVDLFITGSAVRKQNLEKILKAIDEQA